MQEGLIVDQIGFSQSIVQQVERRQKMQAIPTIYTN